MGGHNTLPFLFFPLKCISSPPQGCEENLENVSLASVNAVISAWTCSQPETITLKRCDCELLHSSQIKAVWMLQIWNLVFFRCPRIQHFCHGICPFAKVKQLTFYFPFLCPVKTCLQLPLTLQLSSYPPCAVLRDQAGEQL